MSSDETLPLVDLEGNVTGVATRSAVHRDPSLLHPVVHCLVTNDSGELLLQLRSLHKDVQPGRWDTSVGGHVGLGETVERAVVREIAEELGIVVEPGRVEFLYRYVMRSEIESELVHTYRLVHEGPFRAEPGEIDALKFWDRSSIVATLGKGLFTPNFEDEFRRFEVWTEERPTSNSSGVPTDIQ